MQFGIMLSGDAAGLPALARAAEQAGVESVWLAEHLAWPVDIRSPYPYSETGSPPVTTGYPTYDPWVVLAAVAAATTTVRLGTSVFVLPLRDPHVTARAVGTLDAVSGGRAVLGIGVGWLEEEFAAVGLEFRTRGARTDEIVAILRGLWGPGTFTHDGVHYAFPELHFEPKPPQGERLPVVVGGESPRALRRAAQVGDGWIGLRHTPESAAGQITGLRRLRADGPRAAVPFTVTVGTPGSIGLDDVHRYADAGVDRICLRPWRHGEDPQRGLDRLAGLVAGAPDRIGVPR